MEWEEKNREESFFWDMVCRILNIDPVIFNAPGRRIVDLIRGHSFFDKITHIRAPFASPEFRWTPGNGSAVHQMKLRAGDRRELSRPGQENVRSLAVLCKTCFWSILYYAEPVIAPPDASGRGSSSINR